jgi:glycosyltransferase involved in cell wall biosynthesis
VSDNHRNRFPQEGEDLARLNGLNILVDGDSLELPKGTGIKSYGILLIQAMQALGIHVSVLCSKGTGKDDILSEVLFYDATGPSTSVSARIRHLGDVLRTRFIGPRVPVRVSSGNLVWRYSADAFFGKIVPSVGIYSAENCFAIAHGLDQTFHRPLRLSLPERIDIWHATSPLPITVTRAKKITTIHDIIPLRLPHMTLDGKASFYSRIRGAIKDSDHIICVSECTKTDLEQCFDVDPKKLSVVHHPVIMPDLSDDEIVAGCLKRFGLAPKAYILYVGTMERRKNITGLAAAYAATDTEMPLVMAGTIHRVRDQIVWDDDIRRVMSTPNVKVLEYVGRDELDCLYAGAYMLVFPSFYEGFGLPPLEAMAAGCPVITSNISSLPEICGNAALYVDPTSVFDIRDKMTMLLEDPALREKLSSDGRERAKQFSMAQFINDLHTVYSTVAGG